MELRDNQMGVLMSTNKTKTKTKTKTNNNNDHDDDNNDNDNKDETSKLSSSFMSSQGVGNCFLALQSMDCEIDIVSRMLRKLCVYIAYLTSNSISLDAQAVASILIGHIFFLYTICEILYYHSIVYHLYFIFFNFQRNKKLSIK